MPCRVASPHHFIHNHVTHKGGVWRRTVRIYPLRFFRHFTSWVCLSAYEVRVVVRSVMLRGIRERGVDA